MNLVFKKQNQSISGFTKILCSLRIIMSKFKGQIRMIMKKIIIILLAVFINSCSCKKEISSKPGVSIEGNWELNYISSTASNFEMLYPNAKPTINFNVSEAKVSGKNSCNSYGGNFSLDGMTLDIDEKTLFSTKMFCGGNGEKTFMEALGKVTAYSVSADGSTLSLLSGKTEILRFKKV